MKKYGILRKAVVILLVYGNPASVTMLPFVIAVIIFCRHVMRLAGISVKRGSVFCLAVMLLLALAIYEPYGGFGKLKGLQVTGSAEIVEPFSSEYLKLLEHKKIPLEAMKKLPQPMHLIKIIPSGYDYLDSDLKKEGVSIRQHI